MYSTSTEQLISQIVASGHRLVLCTAGGMTSATNAILSVPNASAAVLEAHTLDSHEEVEQHLRLQVEDPSSEQTARALAMVAFQRAQRLVSDDVDRLIGVGTTVDPSDAAQIHVAWQSVSRTAVISHPRWPGEHAGTESDTTEWLLRGIAEACGVDAATIAVGREPEQRRDAIATTEWSELFLGQREAVYLNSHPETAKLLFPGAFNPLHDGHRQMARIAASRCGTPVTFELSIVNVDKPPLDFIEIDDRLNQFREDPILLTRAPTFVEKAQLAPGSTFVVGIDTLRRMADPRYYGDSDAVRDAAIGTLSDAGCRFLVFGRHDGQRFQTLQDLALPAKLRAISDEVPAEEFRQDISSTDLRR